VIKAVPRPPSEPPVLITQPDESESNLITSLRAMQFADAEDGEVSAVSDTTDVSWLPLPAKEKRAWGRSP